VNLMESGDKETMNCKTCITTKIQAHFDYVGTMMGLKEAISQGIRTLNLLPIITLR
jgi:hypothetical protein